MKQRVIVERLKKGDVKALEKLVETYSDYVRVVARNFSRGNLSKEDIDEIVADVFFRLWERREKLDPEIDVRAYLSASVRNAAKNLFRRCAPIYEDISELDLPDIGSVAEEAEQNEVMKCLINGTEKLPDDEREIFFRYYFNGECTADIAAILNITDNTVYKKLHRARNKLKDHLIERGFDYV